MEEYSLSHRGGNDTHDESNHLWGQSWMESEYVGRKVEERDGLKLFFVAPPKGGATSLYRSAVYGKLVGGSRNAVLY